MTVVVGYIPDKYGEAALAAGIEEARRRDAVLVVVNATKGDALVDRCLDIRLGVVLLGRDDGGKPDIDSALARGGGAPLGEVGRGDGKEVEPAARVPRPQPNE